MPTVQKVHVDKMLSNISIGFKNEEFIADKIFRPVPVDKQSDRYYVYGKEVFRLHDDARAPGTEANEINWTLSDDTYFCEGHALRHPIPDEEKQNADDEFQLEADATELLSEGILLNKEADAAAKALDSDSYDSGLVFTRGGGGELPKWSHEDSDPVKDVEDAKKTLHKASGLRPNILVLSAPVYSALRIHPKLLGIFKNTEVSLVPLKMMKDFFEVDDILIGSALKSSATNPAGGDELSYVWGESAILAYVPKSPKKKSPALGYSFMWNKDGQGAVQTRKWYEMGKRSTIIECERWYDQKIVSNIAGALFPDVL